MIAAIGHGVLFSMAFTGLVRIVCWLLGTTLSPDVAGNLFLVGSILAGSLAAFLCVRTMAEAKPST
jgi:hypothetical protein